MKRFRVTLREEVTYVIEVEADSEEDATAKAMLDGLDTAENAVDWNQIDIEAEEVQ